MTYHATNQNHLNNFGRGQPRDHSCEVWSKSNEWFQRRRCLSKNVYARRTTTDKARSQKLTMSTLCSGELKTTLEHLLDNRSWWLVYKAWNAVSLGSRVGEGIMGEWGSPIGSAPATSRQERTRATNPGLPGRLLEQKGKICNI